MRVGVSRRHKRNLCQGIALLFIGGLAAGCSSGVSRFTTDDFTTSSTSNQQQIINRQSASNDVYTPPVANDGSYPTAASQPASGTVARSSLPPVASQAAVASAEPVKKQAAETATTAHKAIDPLSRAVERSAAEANVKKAKETTARVASADPAGWSSTGGSQITAKEGETVFNLSRRYGVPANVLMKVNGLDDSGALKSGQKILIPTYIYSDRAPVSAPDNNPKVADAKSSRGTKSDAPANKLPADGSKNLAALPATPKVKETASQQTASADSSAKPKSGKGSYTVADGDTLSRIAKKHGVSVSALKAANGGNDALRIGQELKIPAAGETVVAAKATKVDPINTASTGGAKENPAKTEKPQLSAYTPPQKTKAIEAVESESDEAAPTSTGIGRMRWPAKGRVAKARDGIDIQVPEGTAVKAAENGVVIYAGDGLKDFGNTVLVRHENGLVTVYGHAGSLSVKRGQKVKRGEQIATSGMSGETQTPKLHFEVRKDSAPVDPSTYLE